MCLYRWSLGFYFDNMEPCQEKGCATPPYLSLCLYLSLFLFFLCALLICSLLNEARVRGVCESREMTHTPLT